MQWLKLLLSFPGFYARILNKDEVRVNDRFAKAAGANLKVEKRSVNSSEIVDHLISRLDNID